MRPGIHYPDKSDVSDLTHSVNNLKISDAGQSVPEYNTVLSMTGVSIKIYHVGIYTYVCMFFYFFIKFQIIHNTFIIIHHH